MMRQIQIYRTGLIVLAIMVSSLRLSAQIVFSGQASAALVKSDNEQSQYAHNAVKGTFNWRLDVFGDMVISESITFRSSLRMYQDQVPHIDLFALSFADLTPLSLTLDVGEIDLPVGDLGKRRFPMTNPFFELPLMNEHRTSIWYPGNLLWPFDAHYTIAGNGIRLLDQGLYDLGIKISKSTGIADITLALINGTASVSSVYTTEGINADNRFGVIVRLALTPATGLTIGSSYADGRLSNTIITNGSQRVYKGNEFQQHLLEGDVEFSSGHLELYGQVIGNVWRYDPYTEDDLKAFGYSLEGSYTPVPRWTLSMRGAGIFFNSIETELPAANNSTIYYNGRWDHNVSRIEGAVGYRLTREALLKLMYQWNDSVDLVPVSVEQVFALQTVVTF